MCNHKMWKTYYEEINYGHMYTIEYYSTIKKTELRVHVATWINQKGILLSRKSQPEKFVGVYDSICMTFWKR